MQRLVPILRRYSTETKPDLLDAFKVQQRELEMIRNQVKESQETMDSVMWGIKFTLGFSAGTFVLGMTK